MPRSTRLASSVIRMLDGLPLGLAEHVLNQAKLIIKTTHRIDVINPDFIEFESETAARAASDSESRK